LGKGESSLLGPAPEMAHQLAIRIELELALEQIEQVGVAVALSKHVMSRGVVQDGRLIDETLEARWRQVLKRCEPRDQGIEHRAVAANIHIHFFPLGSVSGYFDAPKQWGVSAMRGFAVGHARRGVGGRPTLSAPPDHRPARPTQRDPLQGPLKFLPFILRSLPKGLRRWRRGKMPPGLRLRAHPRFRLLRRRARFKPSLHVMSEKTVFISYRRDTAGNLFARLVEGALTRHGYDVFLDVDCIDAGKWAEQILTEVPEAGALSSAADSRRVASLRRRDRLGAARVPSSPNFFGRTNLTYW
jgi:hypothetical protein